MARMTIVGLVVASWVGLATAEPQIITREEGVVDVMSEDALHALSIEMHAVHDRCGGYIVHESLEEAMAAATPLRPAPAYTIDRPAIVDTVTGAITPASILETIAKLSSFKNRYYLSESGATASHWLRDRWLDAAKLHPKATVELVDHGYPQKSVVLTIRGSSRPSEFVVIGGHIDSIGRGGKDANAPGADDDASGIATLDAVAVTMLRLGYEPERTIQFMAYAAEEVGLRGSMSIVRDYKKRNIDVVGVLQLDMTNYQGSNRDIWLIDDYTSKAQNAFLVRLIEHYTRFTWGTTICGYACSDHASWHRAGYHASAPHETRSQDHNKHIHTSRDTLEVSSNNANHAYKFAVLAAAYAAEMGKGEVPASGMSTRTPDSSPPVLPIAGAALALLTLLGMARRWP